MIPDEALAQHIANALAYPNASEDDFRASYFFSSNQPGAHDDEFFKLRIGDTKITPQGDVHLSGTLCPIPMYTLDIVTAAGQEIHLRDRIAILGYGSNVSPGILTQKYNTCASDGEICVLSATLADHAVVHGAFLGVRGSVPATLYPHPDSASTLTLGFYDLQAAWHMTRSEANYDVVMLDAPARIGAHYVDRPLAYVSIWGALSQSLVASGAANPVRLSVVPARSTLPHAASRDILHAVMQATGASADVETYIAQNILDADKRFARIETLQARFKLCTRIEGKMVAPAAIASDPRARALLARYACA